MNDQITAQKLSEITGLTDRRHRQLASDGFFPSPVKGQYPAEPTLQGLFRYYRERLSTVYERTEAERLRKLQLECEILKRKKDELDRRLVPADLVLRAWEFAIVNIRQIVWNSQMPDELKREVLENVRTIPIDEYFAAATEKNEPED